MATKTQVIYTTNLYLETCCKCGVPFGIPQELYESLQESGNSFYCPNGHSQYYTRKKSLEEKLKDTEARLAIEKEAGEWYAEVYRQAKNELKNTRNSLRATKAAHTRTKNRIKNGVCPCCNRQFINLHQHMKNQHPEYLGEEQPME